jgi:DNA-binding transcriptional regulator YhcF (GntR family)
MLKAKQIVSLLRGEILSGQRAPGEKLPTYDALQEHFEVTRPTIARVVHALRKEGLVEGGRKCRATMVAATFPHHRRYLWVTSEMPGSIEWTCFMATMLELIERRRTGIDGEVVPLVGVDGRANNPAYQQLREAIEHGSVAGLFLMSSATVQLLPALQAPGIPRAAIWAPLPHAGLVRLDVESLVDRAAERLARHGRRGAVISPHGPILALAEKSFARHGFEGKRLWTLQVSIGCEQMTELLFQRPDRPDAVFLTDDNLVDPFLAGLRRANLRAGEDVYVLAHCNWPRPLGLADGVEHIGFDVREVLGMAKECITDQRRGGAAPNRVVTPRFVDELVYLMERGNDEVFLGPGET